MTMLNPKEIPTHIERITIDRLDNGYCVSADTKVAGKVAHYCSNLKGVTKALWFMFEAKTKTTKDQTQFIREIAGKVEDSKPGEKKERNDA